MLVHDPQIICWTLFYINFGIPPGIWTPTNGFGDRHAAITPARYIWCERRDSNSHDFTRWNLNPVRLPITPLSQFTILKHANNVLRCESSHTWLPTCFNMVPQDRIELPHPDYKTGPLPLRIQGQIYHIETHYWNWRWGIRTILCNPALRCPFQSG